MYPLHLEKQVERTFIAAFRSRAEPLIRQIIAAARDHLRPVLSVSGDMVVRADGIGDLIRFMEDLERQNPGGISQEELESAILANYRMIEAAAKAETDKAWRQVQKDRGREIAKTETPLRSSNPEADEFLKERARAGMQMLEDLTGEHRRQVFDIVYESVRIGDTLKTITEKLKEATGASESKAAFWAQDQAGDVHAQLTRIRQKEAGFAGYVWRTMKDARVRDSHIENHGKYFDWSVGASNLEKPGARHPGEDWRCRCYAAPAMVPPAIGKQEEENQRGRQDRTNDASRISILRRQLARIPEPARPFSGASVPSKTTGRPGAPDTIENDAPLKIWTGMGLDKSQNWNEKSAETYWRSFQKNHGVQADSIIESISYASKRKSSIASESAITSALQDILDIMPRSVIESNVFPRLRFTVGNRGRKYVAAYINGTIDLNTHEIRTNAGLREGIFHEVMHWVHLHSSGPKADRYRKTISELYRRRTSGDRARKFHHGRTREDKWYDPYAGFEGKWYDSWDQAKELPTTHFELFGDRRRLVELMQTHEHRDSLPEAIRIVMEIFL